MGTDTSFSVRISGNIFLRYVAAAAVALTASLICGGVHRFAGDNGCYALLLLTVAFSSWYCGIGPSIVAGAIGAFGLLFGFLPKIHSPAALSVPESLGLLIFVACSVSVVLMGEYRRRQNQLLLKAQSELEQRVQERTSDLDAVNHSLRELSARLMQLQDDERRRIARELHDSVGQTLAALAMNLSRVKGDVERLARTAAALTDSENLVRDMSTEVRTISHLLHPPLLDEAGLSSALHWYVDGFAQRSKIKVDLHIPEDMERFSGEMETAIFRVVQECLTNIHRHSGSSIAKIQVRRRHDHVLVEIADRGKGIPLEKQEEMASTGTPGVGIRGMRERLRQLGGTLEISSTGSGTHVTVQIPVAAKPTIQAIQLSGPAAA
jgi:signal transduction histidine kinase